MTTKHFKKKMKGAFPFLNVLRKLPQEDLDILIDYISNEGCEHIVTTIYNALYNTKLQNRAELARKLGTHKNDLRSLAGKRIAYSFKKKKLKKCGGSISLILASLVPLLAQFVK